MKLVTFEARDGAGPGVLTAGDGGILDIRSAATAAWGEVPTRLQSVQAIVEAGDAALEDLRALLDQRSSGEVVALKGAKLLAPLPRPVQVRDFLCFEKHLLQGFQRARMLRASLSEDPEQAMADMERQGIFRVPEAWYDMPLYYRVNPANVCGTDVDVQWPAYSVIMDFEFEFACVIGRRGKDIPVASARDHIFGYMIFNDLSARDEQVRVMPGQLGPGKGKDFDNSKPMGPYLVTADEVGDPYDLKMTARLNGETFVEASSSEMNWRFEDCIAYISQGETLEPGEVLGSGTVGGGCTVEVGRSVSPGDVIELEMEKLGTLRTRFVRTGPNKPQSIDVAPIHVSRS